MLPIYSLREHEMSEKFSGLTAIISGGAGGIGFAIAKELGRLKMRIVIADIDESLLLTAKNELESLGINTLACVLDVSDLGNWKRVVAEAQKTYGCIDMLVNNAGVSGLSHAIENTDAAQWRWLIDVNLMGVVHGAQASIPAIKSHGKGGWIINVASMAGLRGMPYSSDYSATKAAVVALTECWADELKPFDIKVSSLCPAFVNTRIHQSNRVRQDKYIEKTEAGVSDEDFSKNKASHKDLVEKGMSADAVAQQLIKALFADQKYIFTHPEFKEHFHQKTDLISSSFSFAEECLGTNQ